MHHHADSIVTVISYRSCRIVVVTTIEDQELGGGQHVDFSRSGLNFVQAWISYKNLSVVWYYWAIPNFQWHKPWSLVMNK